MLLKKYLKILVGYFQLSYSIFNNVKSICFKNTKYNAKYQLLPTLAPQYISENFSVLSYPKVFNTPRKKQSPLT